MTKEELLIKRVIVQHLYPNSCFKINDILTLETDPHDKTYKAYGKIGRFYISEKEVNDSIESGSNDFLLLEWWEYRDLKDMPEYVLLTNMETNKITYGKIFSYDKFILNFHRCDSPLKIWDILPITKEENDRNI